MKPDWEAIKAEYIRGGISQQKLADKHGVHRSTLHRRMVKEGWQQLRNEAEERTEEKLVEIVSETQAEALARLNDKQTRLAEAIYDKLLDSIAKYPAGAGTRIMRETVSMTSVTMDDGSEKKYPLKSAIVTDLESITRAMSNLGRLVGIDAGTKLDYERLALKVNPAAGMPEEDDDGFLTALSAACNDAWSIHDVPANVDDAPDNNLIDVLRESMNDVNDDAIPELGQHEGQHEARANECKIVSEARDGRFIFFTFEPMPKGLTVSKLLIDGDTFPRVYPRGGNNLPSIGIEAEGSFIGKTVRLME